jgi:hypothetical protein
MRQFTQTFHILFLSSIKDGIDIQIQHKYNDGINEV